MDARISPPRRPYDKRIRVKNNITVEFFALPPYFRFGMFPMNKGTVSKLNIKEGESRNK